MLLNLLAGPAIVLSAFTSTVVAQGTPDKPIKFYAQLFQNSSTCQSGGRTSAFLESRGACQNIAVSGNGSAKIVVGEVAKYYLGAWTGLNCTGKVVLVESNVGECNSLGGIDVKSWSSDDRVFK